MNNLMDDQRDSAITSLFKGAVPLQERTSSLSEQYRNAKPFPHVVIDDAFSPQILHSLIQEISAMSADEWVSVDKDTRERTLRMHTPWIMGPAGTDFLKMIHSAAFLQLLGRITGISHLLPDPYLLGGGYALMQAGDYFHVHADRSSAYDTGLMRRLAMIVFLNEFWLPQFGGELELWNDKATRCEASFEPVFNRAVIFEVKFPNYHGVPRKICCPDGMKRKSMQIYFHTVAPEGSIKAHTTVFAPRTHGTNRIGVRGMIKEIAPPFLVKWMRRRKHA